MTSMRSQVAAGSIYTRLFPIAVGPINSRCSCPLIATSKASACSGVLKEAFGLAKNVRRLFKSEGWGLTLGRGGAEWLVPPVLAAIGMVENPTLIASRRLDVIS